VAVASDEHGGAVAVWDELATDSSVSSSELRPGGPVLARLAMPESGAARVATTFAVTPAAWGSPLAGAATWSFGDGGTGSGSRVLHTYRRPGTYTVTVAASDASGATSTARGTIVVDAATLANVHAPTIAGRHGVGGTLTCRRGSWRGTQPIRFRYTWLRNRVVVSGTSRYRVRPRDAGALIACRVTATNGALTRSATSPPVRIR
jgi:PKD repeat protein